MRLINLTYPTYSEEIKQGVTVNSSIEGLRDSETSQTLRTTRLKKISEVLAYALQFDIAKQTSRKQERIIRKVDVFQDYSKINDEISTRLMREIQEFLSKRKRHDSKSTTFRIKNIIRCWKCGPGGHV